MRTLTPDIVTGPMSTAGVASAFVPRDPSAPYETGGLLDVPGTFDFTFDACELPFYPEYGANNL
jgi:hypothetical protein